MNLTELRERITNLRNSLTTAINNGAALASIETTTLAQLEESNANVERLRAQLTALTAQMTDMEATGPAAAPAGATAATVVATGRGARTLTGSNEYMRAWGRAIRMGLTPERACPSDDLRVLYDALTTTGGDPAGSDGGFLVPDDVDHTIRELLRDFGSLRDLVSVETVTTTKGTRVRDNAPTKGLVLLEAEGDDINDTDDQPSFAQVNYTVLKYALIIDISRELLKDNVANLAAYVARWFARKQTITENKLIIARLNALSSQNITPADDKDAIRHIRSLLTVALDPAISARATVLTNQSGMDYLDGLVDGNGRPLLSYDNASGLPMLLRSRPIRMVSDALLPNRVVTTVGATKGTYLPVYVGDAAQYMTLFEREGLEFVTTDVGGDAFTRDMVKARGITRLGTGVFDAGAMVRREIFLAD